MKLAVTGVGIVSPLGHNLEINLNNLKNMQVPLRDGAPSDDFCANLINTDKFFSADYADADLSPFFDRRDLKYADPICKTSMLAVDEALQQSGWGEQLPDNTSVYVGSIQGGRTSEMSWIMKILAGRDKIHPNSLLNSAHEYVSNVISQHYGLHGACNVIAATCISGVQALQCAHDHLVATDSDAAIVGATDFMTTSTTLFYFQQLGAFSSTPKSTPWDVDRDGIIMGEGSAYLIVEPLDKAEARGAPVRWVIDGIGIASDSYHPTQPDPEGTGGNIAIREAMNQAGAIGVDYKVFNAHATGTDVGDPIEYNVLKKYFPQGKLYSNKGQIGHMMGASCMAELVLGAEAMCAGWVPGNAGLVTPFTDDEHFELTRNAQEYEYTRLMKTSFGFGGRSSAVSVYRYD